MVATRSLLGLSDREATAVSCWHLVATVRDSWLVMAATLLGCWHWHLGAIVTWDTWLEVMAATLRECWRWHLGASVVDCRLLREG